MAKSVFDEKCAEYDKVLDESIGLSIYGGHDFFDNFKIDFIKNLFSNQEKYHVLDFGCGNGRITALLAQAFSKSIVSGYDISEKTIKYARKFNYSIKNLNFIDKLPENQRYDIILVANVFHHIEKTDRSSILKKISRVLHSGGTIIIFEHNPYNPLTRKIVNRCPFDADAELIKRQEFIKLAQSCGLSLKLKQYIVMFPWANKIFRRIEYLFSQIPLGAQYVLFLSRLSK